jgi:hypothetical protein
MLARDSDASSHRWLGITGPPPAFFTEVFILKALKVDCFYRFTEVFILRYLRGKNCCKIGHFL